MAAVVETAPEIGGRRLVSHPPRIRLYVELWFDGDCEDRVGATYLQHLLVI